ncbi:hypothetical protein [Lentzea aerocolonigenes]|uniref:hypothetical protein n=1 Tax=Lentzea aerocolonigenes TaxID=68170 RepID=UPI0004C3084F|nr:hypothetical protein [Lentzea aerocolonigenes]MCP2245862.1 hypothetical protein [Lentzea aerocolonigenes]
MTGWRSVALAAAFVSVAATVGLAVVARAAAPGCQWENGFTADVAVGDRVNGWRLIWTWPSGRTSFQWRLNTNGTTFTFKEFDRILAPNCATGVTTLTPEFFAETNDNARVTLTFHCWSGAVVTCHVTRSGSSVSGSAGS